ncbi:Cytochrome c oxidase subunit 6C-2 [Lemmus lemmus]
MRGLRAKRLRLHIVGAFIVALGVAAVISLAWLNPERRCMQISTGNTTPGRTSKR